MRKKIVWSLTLGIWCFLSTNAFVNADGNAQNGRHIYEMQCLRCHGQDGHGDGLDAKRLTVFPRDLTSGVFKFKSTEFGTPPTDDDIVGSILGHGLPGSGMPSFGNLNKAARADLLAYIKTISPAFQNGIAPKPILDPGNMKASPNLEKGKEVFMKMQCALCHGPNGRANGTSAFTQRDKWDRPIKVANLTHGWQYRGGHRPIDIYHRILAGIEGAPMPSYEGAASHEDIWQLCQYVASLQLKTNWSGEVTAVRLNNVLPAMVSDAQWNKAPATDVNLQGYLYENDRREALTVSAVRVQAFYNDTTLALRLAWDDPVMDDGALVDGLLVAIKPSDFKADIRDNLHTLYDNGATELDLARWQATNLKAVAQKTSNLAALRAGWVPSQILEANAAYDDGRWTVVVTRPLKLDGAETLEPGHVRQIAFAAWDGHNAETGLKRSVSQWIRLNLGEASASSHH